MAAGNHNVAEYFRPGIAAKNDAVPAAVFHIPPLPMPMQKVPLDPGTHARAVAVWSFSDSLDVLL